MDWLGSLGILLLAAYLRAEVGLLPPILVELMQVLKIQTYNFWADPIPREILPWQVYVLVAIIWPFFFIIFCTIYENIMFRIIMRS